MTFDDESSETVDAWQEAIGPWQPHPLTRPEPAMARARRVWLLAIIALGHGLVFLVLDYSSRLSPLAATEPMTLVFLLPEEPLPAPEPAPAPLPEPARPAIETQTPTAPASAPARPAATPSRPPREPRPMVAVELPPRDAPRDDTPLKLYGVDGTLALPDDVVARIGDVEDDARTFDFQMPGLAESGRFMERQPVLVYEATSFDRYWIPEKDILTSVLEKAVEATTGTVEIPIPGSPGSKLVCTVSILAAGGGCGIVNNNDGYVVQLDDPDTLNAEEDAQCRAWWEQIVSAGDQDTWRHTRDLYEFSCRKPLEKVTEPPG